MESTLQENGTGNIIMMNVIKLDEKSADVFWQLRVRLFDELGEIDAETDIDELELATKRYYLIHINDDLISRKIKLFQ